MGNFDPSFVHALSVQSWSLYSVGMFLILLRFYARIHRLGIKCLQADDYLMALAGVLYTMLIVCLNVISGGGGSNLYLPDEFDTFTPVEIQERIKGSKIVVASEQAMLNVIYTIKCCMLLMYTRLTLGLQVQKMVKYLAVYVAIGWLSTEHVRITNSAGRDVKSKRLSHNGVTTTIHGRGESTEDLSSNDQTEMKTIFREDSWEQQNPNISQGDIELVGDKWESQEMKDGVITMTTTVQMVEEHAGSTNVRPLTILPSEKDLEKNGRVGFKWDLERDHDRK